MGCGPSKAAVIAETEKETEMEEKIPQQTGSMSSDILIGVLKRTRNRESEIITKRTMVQNRQNISESIPEGNEISDGAEK